jgi:hypothetical protein
MKHMSLVFLVVSTLTTYSHSEEMKCVRWSWTGDVYDRKVVCLEWKKETKK